MSTLPKPEEKTLRGVAATLVRSLAYICGAHRDTKKQSAAAPRPRRILIINPAHLGDILLSGSIIPVLQSAYPGVEIGFAVGSWCETLVRGMPGVTFVHRVDHWWLNRSSQSRFPKLIRYFRTRRAALREIAGLQYDVCLCPYPFYAADMVFFAWQAGIPLRIAFSRSVFAAFASAVAEMPKSDFIHQGRVYAAILQPLAIPDEHLRKRKAALAPGSAEAESEVCGILGVAQLSKTSYHIVHIGSGNACKELSVGFWRSVAMQLSGADVLLFTGTGSREDKLIAEVIQGLDNCINACGRLSWSGFVAAVRGCRILYAVDTMAGHVAAAVGTRCVVVYSGIGGVARWRPDSDNCIVLTNHVACAPCHLPHGCSDMKCLSGVSPQDVLNAGMAFPADDLPLRSGQKIAPHLRGPAEHGLKFEGSGATPLVSSR